MGLRQHRALAVTTIDAGTPDRAEEMGAQVTGTDPDERRPGPSRKGPTLAENEPTALVDAVIRLMPDASVVVDGDGVIIGANALAEQMFGYPPGALVGMGVETLIPERFRTQHVANRRTYSTDPRSRPMGAGLDLWARRRDGSEFPVDVSLAPLGVPERPLVMAAVRDLTERRAAAEAQSRLAAIVAASDDAIVSLALAGTVTSWNPGAERLLGYRAEEIVGRPLWRLVPAGRRAALEETMARVRAGLRTPTYDSTCLRKDGTEVEVACSVSLMRDQAGRPAGFAAILRDITERKRAEDELRHVLIQLQRRERLVEATAEIRLLLLSGEELARSMKVIAQRAAELADAEGAALALPVGDGLLHVVAAEGAAANLLEDTLAADDSILGAAVTSTDVVVTDRLSEESGFRLGEGTPAARGPAAAVPLRTAAGPKGALLVVRHDGRPPFAPDDIDLIVGFAEQAGLAVELARARQNAEQLAVVADRERIARDLHDHVIQRLFAVGMSLQAASHTVADPAALARLQHAVDELDATIRQVRSTIFSLEQQARGDTSSSTSTRARVLQVVSQSAEALGFQPRLQFDGPIDAAVPEALVADLLAVVREALANTAKHAAANSVEVALSARDELVVEVTDDGTGIGTPTRASGLANLRARAERHGGSLEVTDRSEGGTRLRWRVPLARS